MPIYKETGLRVTNTFFTPWTKYDELPLQADGADGTFGPLADAPYEIFGTNI